MAQTSSASSALPPINTSSSSGVLGGLVKGKNSNNGNGNGGGEKGRDRDGETGGGIGDERYPLASPTNAAHKASLVSWWKNFTSGDKDKDKSGGGRLRGLVGGGGGGGGAGGGGGGEGKVFGVPLRESLKYASVAICMAGSDGNTYVYGYIPVVVAKCGLYLKENGVQTEGVFRISGSSKRMKELQQAFDSPPRYGKDLDWSKHVGSVHDAASVLRRYLTMMPEPVVPTELWSSFRVVHTKQPFVLEEAIQSYKSLISSIADNSQYLLLYILDLLALFARNSEFNKMSASNLAITFQPGMVVGPLELALKSEKLEDLPHGRSLMEGAKEQEHEHKLSQEVLEFLIEHQDHFVARLDPGTTKSVGSGTAAAGTGGGNIGGDVPSSSGLNPAAVDAGQAANSTQSNSGGGVKQSPVVQRKPTRVKISPFNSSGTKPVPSPGPGKSYIYDPEHLTDVQMIPSDDEDVPIGGWIAHRGGGADLGRNNSESRKSKGSVAGGGGQVKRSRTLPGRKSEGGNSTADESPSTSPRRSQRRQGTSQTPTTTTPSRSPLSPQTSSTTTTTSPRAQVQTPVPTGGKASSSTSLSPPRSRTSAEGARVAAGAGAGAGAGANDARRTSLDIGGKSTRKQKENKSVAEAAATTTTTTIPGSSLVVPVPPTALPAAAPDLTGGSQSQSNVPPRVPRPS